MPSLTAGELVAGRFEIVEPLGAGGLAEVYAAKDKVAGGLVALKLLHRHLQADTALAERFRREMAVTRQLDHPGIVRAFEGYEHQGRPLFAMELLRGETLAERLRKSGKLAFEEARRIARAIASALEAAHRRGVVHRDLKPENVFLTEAGQVKLLDFGQARATGLSKLTSKSAMMGTPGYLAPELLSGHSGDARADLYALGAVYFEMLTGKAAYDSEDPFRVIKLQAAGAASPKAAEASVTPADDALVRRLLDPDPEKRFQSAGLVLDALAGKAVAEAIPLPPALMGGEFQVRVHPGGRNRSRMNALVRLLGAVPRPLIEFGSSIVVVGGASHDAAEQVARLAAEQGLAAEVEPARPRRRWEALLARLAPLVGAVAGGAVGLALWRTAQNATRFEAPLSWRSVLTHGVALVYTALCAFTAFGFSSWIGRVPLLSNLPEGDPVVQRLAEGIRRRMALLAERAGRSGPAGAALLETARQMEREAQVFALRLQGKLSAPQPEPDPEQEEQRDHDIAGLLGVASALDAALAASTVSPEGLSTALERLRSEVRLLGDAPAPANAYGARKERA